MFFNRKNNDKMRTVLESQNSAFLNVNPWVEVYRRIIKNKATLIALIILLTIILLSIFAPMLSVWGYKDVDSNYNNFNVGPTLHGFHFFGLDINGRDLFVRTLYGTRISLAVGLSAALFSLFIGVIYGAIAGFMGGKVDSIMMRIVDIIYGLPFIFIVILLVVVFGNSVFLLFIAIGMVEWLTMARIVRGQALSLKKKEFIEAAYSIGVPTYKIVLRHIIPNIFGIILVYITLTVPGVILAESFLSFLGLGISEPTPSLGILIGDGAKVIETSPWRLIFPVMFLSTTLFCFDFIGNGLRDAFDPKG